LLQLLNNNSIQIGRKICQKWWKMLKFEWKNYYLRKYIMIYLIFWRIAYENKWLHTIIFEDWSKTETDARAHSAAAARTQWESKTISKW
jgi:hypothetical protein